MTSARRFPPLSHWGPLACLCLAGLPSCEREEKQESRSQNGSEQPEVLSADSKAHRIGEPAKAPSFEMSVESVEECPVPRPFSIQESRRMIGVEVVIEGTSNRQVPVNPFYATLRDESGTVYSSTLGPCKPPLEAQRVSGNEKATGRISFDIPKSAQKLELVYAPTVIGTGKEEVRFDLGR